jgi:hypothetical protein
MARLKSAATIGIQAAEQMKLATPHSSLKMGLNEIQRPLRRDPMGRMPKVRARKKVPAPARNTWNTMLRLNTHGKGRRQRAQFSG